MKLIRWIFALAVLSIWAALIGTALYVAMYEADATVPEADAIVVLSANPADSSGISGETAARVAAGRG